MKHQLQFIIRLSIFFIATSLFSVQLVKAADVKTYIITNNTTAAASDLHITFSGTGGNLTTVVVTNPAPCPMPAIPSNGTVTNTMVVDWGINCVAIGASVTVTVSTTNGPLLPVGGFWTDLANQDSPGIGIINSDSDIEESDSDGGEDNDDENEFGSWAGFFLALSLILLFLLIYLWRKLHGLQLQDEGEDEDDKPLSALDEAIIELESKRDLLKRLRRGRTDKQKALIDEALEELDKAIDGLKKMRDGDPKAPSEGEIEKAIRKAADKIEEANPDGGLPLKRLVDCLRDIARNLF